MKEERVRVLVVDDSALVREVLSAALSKCAGIEVVGTARDGATALAAVERLRPDAVTLDVEMPGMSGLDVLDRVKNQAAVVVVASRREAAQDLALAALTRGAFDFVPKPASLSGDLSAMIADLSAKLRATRALRQRTRARLAAGPVAMPAPVQAPRASGADKVIAIGASTGGPEAVATVLAAMPADAPPIIVVQHMPEHFTTKFAARLDAASNIAIRVREARDGDVLRPGLALLAPGTTHHMFLRREAAGLVVRLNTDAPVMHHRPSVDVLFHSCAAVLGKRAVGVILTGMGADGARGLLAMRRAGALTIAQDERTSFVFGMPMEAAAIGAACHVLPLEMIGASAVTLARGGRLAA